jgi:hypothetical protein
MFLVQGASLYIGYLVHIVLGTNSIPALNMFFLFDRAVDQEELDIAQASQNIHY